MAKEGLRASWNMKYEKALVDILDHNQAKFRRQNGWVSEGWRSIVIAFNAKFPTANFTKQQIQEKKKELKANYKLLRDARKQSGVSWDDTLGMIKAEPAIWERLIAAFPKLKKFHNKPFPLFKSSASLYEGSTTACDLNFTSVDPVTAPASDHQVDTSIIHMQETINLEGEDTSSAHKKVIEVQRPPSAVSEHKDEGPRRKRKQSQIAGVLENYLEFKMEQSKKSMEKQSGPARAASDYSIGNCVAVLESIQELSDVEKVKALKPFKCEQNREIFLNTKNPTLRLLWIKSEIEPWAYIMELEAEVAKLKEHNEELQKKQVEMLQKQKNELYSLVIPT